MNWRRRKSAPNLTNFKQEQIDMSFEGLKKEVIEPGLCARCGICAGVCPTKAIAFDQRSYPTLIGKCTDCSFCNGACPGADVDFNALSDQLFGHAPKQARAGLVLRRQALAWSLRQRLTRLASLFRLS